MIRSFWGKLLSTLASDQTNLELENKPAVLTTLCVPDSLLWALGPEMLPLTQMMRHLGGDRGWMKHPLQFICGERAKQSSPKMWVLTEIPAFSLFLSHFDLHLGPKCKSKEEIFGKSYIPIAVCGSIKEWHFYKRTISSSTHFIFFLLSSYNQRLKCSEVSIPNTGWHFFFCCMSFINWGTTSWWWRPD